MSLNIGSSRLVVAVMRRRPESISGRSELAVWPWERWIFQPCRRLFTAILHFGEHFTVLFSPSKFAPSSTLRLLTVSQILRVDQFKKFYETIQVCGMSFQRIF